MHNYLEIGQIVNTFGIKGLVKVNPYTDDITRFDDLKNIYLTKKGIKKEYEIEEVKYQKNVVLLKLKGIDDMTAAENLRDYTIIIDRKDAVKLPKDSYFIVDLIGLEVYSEENTLLGKIIDVFSTKSNDIYVVKDDEGKQILLPAIKDVVKNIDIENGKMIIHLIDGLVD